MFVTTKYFCHNKYIFITTNVLSHRAYFCHDKRCVLSWQTGICRDKSKLVATEVLSQENFICCRKYLSWQKFCCNKDMFVATKVLLQQAHFCHDKTLVATKIILAGVPANDKKRRSCTAVTNSYLPAGSSLGKIHQPQHHDSNKKRVTCPFHRKDFTSRRSRFCCPSGPPVSSAVRLTESATHHIIKVSPSCVYDSTTVLSLVGAATSIIFVVTNTCCHDKTRLLLQQKYACRDKAFVMTKLCLSQQIFVQYIFVETNLILSWQAYFCCDKHMFVMTKHVFCRNENDTCGSSHQCYYAGVLFCLICLV